MRPESVHTSRNLWAASLGIAAIGLTCIACGGGGGLADPDRRGYPALEMPVARPIPVSRPSLPDWSAEEPSPDTIKVLAEAPPLLPMPWLETTLESVDAIKIGEPFFFGNQSLVVEQSLGGDAAICRIDNERFVLKPLSALPLKGRRQLDVVPGCWKATGTVSLGFRTVRQIEPATPRKVEMVAPRLFVPDGLKLGQVFHFHMYTPIAVDVIDGDTVLCALGTSMRFIIKGVDPKEINRNLISLVVLPHTGSVWRATRQVAYRGRHYLQVERLQ